MSHELMITKYENHICACYYEDNQLTELQIITPSILGNIYVAKVQNVVKNLEAAFVEIQPGVVCYYSLTENQHHFLNPKNTNRLVVGDEILVQVTKEAVKSKAPTAGSELHLTGNLVVVTLGAGKVGVSKKLPNDSQTQTMKAALEQRLPQGYGAILRTNSYESSLDAVEAEFERLLKQLSALVEQAKYHKAFTCLYQERSSLQRILNDYNNHDLTQIITDLPEIEAELRDYLAETDKEKLRLYSGELQPLYALYRLDRDWKEITGKRVWLKSGAYLVIEQTEAMVVIDVNTGKAVNKKKREEHFLKVNQEAATEIARQLRLRNLSGIIMIDFIDLENLKHKEELIQHLCREIKKDRIQTTYVDMTGLNLVELTRKKVQKSLAEQFFEDLS